MKRIYTDRKAFSSLDSAIKLYEANNRTKSAAFLIWFLVTIYRLDDTEAQDAVCDRKGDAGVDAIIVNDDQQEIVLFQSVRREKIPSTLGDKELREFVGALHRFTTKKAVEQLIETTSNEELRNLLIKNKLSEKIDEGYSLRPVFIINVAKNLDAENYLAPLAEFKIDLWDLSRLGPVLNQLNQKGWVIDKKTFLSLDNQKLFVAGSKSDPSLIFAAIKANELVKLPGIDDTRVFAQNVRLGLGNTRVNKEILASVQKKDEHQEFLAFHNGMTIVAKDLKVRGRKLFIDHYSVCNGCQSLLTFYNNRNELTDKLEILVRFVRVGDDRRIIESIAYRTNNQNPVSLRDLRSNDPVQVQLKAEFDDLFGDQSTYIIKAGESALTEELSNEYAGRLLLAFFTGMPWSAHQKYKIFGELEKNIFKYGITASHIRLAQLIDNVIQQNLNRLQVERIRKYSLTKFIILYLVGEILRRSNDGEELLVNPKSYLLIRGEGSNCQSSVLSSIEHIINFIIIDMNYFIDLNGGEKYDYKDKFKSEKEIITIRNEVLKSFDKDLYRKKIDLFSFPKC